MIDRNANYTGVYFPLLEFCWHWNSLLVLVLVVPSDRPERRPSVNPSVDA